MPNCACMFRTLALCLISYHTEKSVVWMVDQEIPKRTIGYPQNQFLSVCWCMLVGAAINCQQTTELSYLIWGLNMSVLDTIVRVYCASLQSAVSFLQLLEGQHTAASLCCDLCHAIQHVLNVMAQDSICIHSICIHSICIHSVQADDQGDSTQYDSDVHPRQQTGVVEATVNLNIGKESDN